MADDLIKGNSLLRAADRVRAKREAERVAPGVETEVITTTAQVRARLNSMPNNETLQGLIHQALNALSRGVRWARGSIVNLIV